MADIVLVAGQNELNIALSRIAAPEAGYFSGNTWVYATPLPYEWQSLSEGAVIPLSEIEATVFKSLEIGVDFVRGPGWYSGYGENAYYGYFTFDILWPDGVVRSGTLGMLEIPGGCWCEIVVCATVEPKQAIRGKYIATVRMYPYYTMEVLFAEASRTFYIG